MCSTGTFYRLLAFLSKILHIIFVKDTIVQDGDPVLRAKAKPIFKKDIGSRKLATIIDRMKRALASEEYGVAIAAPQVGESLRLFVVAGRVFEKENAETKEDEPARAYINPVITRLSRKKIEMAEGCLSVRGQYGTVMRHEKATLDALDESGKAVHIHASGLLAHIFQHEVDHLEGILYIDKAERLEDEAAREELKGKYHA
jgi:peptide deformylase